MTQTLQNKLSNSKKARWTALILVSITMMLGYFFTDVMSPLEPLLTEARGLTEAQGGTGFGLGWTSDEYGFFSGAYGYFNVFLLLLFLGGVILDKFGIRFTGIMSTILMFLGAILNGMPSHTTLKELSMSHSLANIKPKLCWRPQDSPFTVSDVKSQVSP